MTGMFVLGMQHSQPQDEDEVRSTVEPVRNDSIEAEEQHAPEWNEFASDDSGQLVGLSPRVAGADTTDTIKYPASWAADASAPHNEIVDQQVASSGTASRREEAGQQGHGTMQYANSMEPVIRDGARYGNDYFVVNDQSIQEGAGEYMQPDQQDQWAQAVAQSNAAKNSRAAFQSTAYDNFLKG
jgi:hypothetical protein